VALLVVIGAAGQAGASALAGAVLVHRSGTMFTALAVALLAAVLSDLVVGLITAGLTADWAADVRRRLCRVALGQDLQTLETTPVGELLDRIDGDVYQVASELRGSGVRIVQSLAMGVLSVVTALVIWWPAGLAMLLLAALLAVGLSGPAGAISAARMGEEEAWSDLAAVMEESIHGQDDVRTSLARPYVLRLYARRAAEVLSRGRRVWLMSARVTAIASTVTGTGIAVVVIGGVAALATGRIDAARLTAAWLLALAFGGTVEHVSRMVPQLQYALGAWGRVQLLNAARQEPTGGAAPADGDVVVRGLTFRYAAGEPDDGRRPALCDVNLTFARGSSYALVGRTGSGKSTLAKVLTRAVDLRRGTVFLGGTDLVDLDVEGLRRWVAVVPQRTEILAGTLAENVALFDPDLLEPAAAALRELGLTAWVDDLPDGIDTRLGDGGYVLSAGQEQLVAFARILVRDPHVVILDEATARMDPVTEARVQRATERLLLGRIGIVIAHRLSSVRRCDEVVVMADGAVVEAGPLRRSARFARLLAASNAAAVGAVPVGTANGGGVVHGGGAVPGGAAITVPGKADPPPLPEPAPTRTLREIFQLAMNDEIAASPPGLVPGRGPVWTRRVGAAVAVVDLVDGTGSPVWMAGGRDRRRAAGDRADPVLHEQVVPGVVGPPDAADQPAAGARADRPAPGERAHPCRGHRPGRGHRAGGDARRQPDRPVRRPGHHRRDDRGHRVGGARAVLRRDHAGVRARGDPVRAAAGTLGAPDGRRAGGVRHGTGVVAVRVTDREAGRGDRLGAGPPVPAGHPAQRPAAPGDLDPGMGQIDTVDHQRSAAGRRLGAVPVRWPVCGGDPGGGVDARRGQVVRVDHRVPGVAAALGAGLDQANRRHGRHRQLLGRGAGGRPLRGDRPARPHRAGHPLRRSRPGRLQRGPRGRHGRRPQRRPTVERGQLVLVVGPVGSGKSSLLRALAGIVHHTGELRWNGSPVDEPELFLRPNQVGYVAQLPRVLSGTIADNIRLGHEVDAAGAVSTAQLDHDLAAAGGGLGLLIGHKGTRLSGGQLQAGAGQGARSAYRAADRRRRVLGAGRHHRARPVAGAARARGDRGRLDLEAGGAYPGRPRGGPDRRADRGDRAVAHPGRTMGPPRRVTPPATRPGRAALGQPRQRRPAPHYPVAGRRRRMWTMKLSENSSNRL
jgi:ABC-type multidrug transport system fused ATPase/permease subunit